MTIDVSFLRFLYTDKESGLRKLHQAKITDFASYNDFTQFAADFWSMATYPVEQSSKYECYGWTPTIFEESWRDDRRGERPPQWGHWRNGDHAVEGVSLLMADLDNNNPDRPTITLDDAEAVIADLGAPYLLYTSFSHRPDHHKVRIVVAISAPVDFTDHYRLGVWLNGRLNDQLDLAIYDPGDHLYGPGKASERRQSLTSDPLDVAAILAELPVYDRPTASGVRRPETVEEWSAIRARMSDHSTTSGVTITNPAIFNPDWLADLQGLYQAGSHRQSLYGLLTRIWLKSGGQLSFGDLQTLHFEMDEVHGGYVRRKYGLHDIETDIRTAMASVSRPTTAPTMESRLAANLKRLRKR